MEDINDNVPEFTKSSYIRSIPEAPYGEGGSMILDVTAADKDSGRNALVTYSMESPDTIPFRIDPNNGKVRIFGDIDREIRNSYFFTIIVCKGQFNNCAITKTWVLFF